MSSLDKDRFEGVVEGVQILRSEIERRELSSHGGVQRKDKALPVVGPLEVSSKLCICASGGCRERSSRQPTEVQSVELTPVPQ